MCNPFVTLWIVLDKMDLMWIPVYRDWRLNERHYGALQGLNKAETAVKYGEQQVHLWRRSYDVRPPAIDTSDLRYPGHDPLLTIIRTIFILLTFIIGIYGMNLQFMPELAWRWGYFAVLRITYG